MVEWVIEWREWHQAYDDPGSSLSLRLAAVREQVSSALSAAPAGVVRVLSLCAGQGRDLLGVLPTHPRRADVRAVLVELDPDLAPPSGPGVSVRVGDAGLVSGYADAFPAEVLMLCGIFGNISEADIRRTVRAAGGLTAEGGVVIWTRHREEPDLFPRVCGWFEEAGFAPVFVSAPSSPFGLAVHRRVGPPIPVAPGTRLFTFDGRYSG
jgi:hypothetical protein